MQKVVVLGQTLGQSSLRVGINAVARSPLIKCQQVDPETNEPCEWCQRGAAQLAMSVQGLLPLEVRVMTMQQMHRELSSMFSDA